MSLLTTTIGAYPKPEYVSLPDRFRQGSAVARGLTGGDEDFFCPQPRETQELLDRATREAVREQVSMGIDIPTDGEIRREHYIYYHCRHLQGIDFSTLTHKIMRSGSWKAAVPTIVGPIQAINRFLQEDWRVAQSATNRPVKITIPGPMTIADSVADVYYGNEQTLGRALAEALNSEIRALADAGCRWIQVDEPVFVREPERALSYGIGNLERCFHGVPKGVKRIVHLCCGYPDRVDNDAYPKADPTVYPRLATPLDEAQIDALSIEDAYRHNHLTLLEKFKKSTVILGVIAIARSRVESVEEISRRIQEALRHIDPTRLMLAPDCGLGMLNRETVREKIKSMVKATRLVT